MAASLHHIAAIVRSADRSARWYTEVFGLRVNWTLTAFSDLTLKRLPGLTRIDELVADGIRVHLMEVRDASAGPADVSAAAFQHACLSVGSPDELAALHARSREAAESGDHAAAPPSEIIVDADGVASFYLSDPDHLEWEITCVPATAAGR
jgi:catechol 2,3-dioxygenase-like lactoylglutathione lyase family enzyme